LDFLQIIARDSCCHRAVIQLFFEGETGAATGHVVKFASAANALTQTILNGLLPRHCLMCGFASGMVNLCGPCADELPRVGHSCLQCGLPMSHIADRFCGHCLRKPPPWDFAVSALAYRFPVDQLVCRFKFGRSLACGQVLSSELIKAIESRRSLLPGCILPVPLHRLRHFSRTFNQADLLARHVGKALGLPVYGSILRRRRRTRAHSGLDALTRKQNIKGAFACKITADQRTSFEHVALVDDVMTTGATLAECAGMLKKAGAGTVSVWVAARTLEPHQLL
jgi:ComF family protein